jgi:hypothetical protein
MRDLNWFQKLYTKEVNGVVRSVRRDHYGLSSLEGLDVLEIDTGKETFFGYLWISGEHLIGKGVKVHASRIPTESGKYQSDALSSDGSVPNKGVKRYFYKIFRHEECGKEKPNKIRHLELCPNK